MSIPTCIKLEQNQIDKFQRFYNFVLSTMSEEDIQDSIDCCCTSPFSFSCFSSGLGDTIYVTAFGYKCDLSIDNDNELGPDEFIKQNL